MKVLNYISIFILTFISIWGKAQNTINKNSRPNIVMLYIDDWAWYGTPVHMNDAMENSRMPVLQMPHIEKLANQGMKFSNAYGSPMCAPARVCLQTGQSAPRSGFTVYLGKTKDTYYDMKKEYQYFPLVPNVSDLEIDKNAVTIARALKPLGYVSAHIGKWHMRGNPEEEGYVLSDGATDNKPGQTLTANLKPGDPKSNRIPKDMDDPKLMFSSTKKAIGFMEEQVNKNNPFYLQISYYAMHEGRECLYKTRQKYVNDPRVQAWYKRNNKDTETINRRQDPAVWLGMGDDLDGRIGAVLDKIKELGIEDNTYVILTSDNGYRDEELEITGLKQPLHGAKWWAWDGGIRVPMIVKGPGIKPGSVFKGNVVNYDFLPTFVDWAGGDPGKLKNIDGVSLADYMAAEKPDKAFLNRNLYFHYPHYRTSVPHSAVISGKYKVLHFYEFPDIPMLFDLSKDPGEVSNIAKQYPNIQKKLYDEMMDYLKEVGARFPKVNPNYNPEEYKKSKETESRIKWGAFEGQRPLDEDEK